jgi:crotonobetainyl-CoA:carnitine CoA-transferase CaiB-like acyl-CoA transferase
MDITPINRPADLLESKQLKARDYWVDLKHPESGTTLTYPKYFFLSNETENFVKRRAPIIGEDNDEIYANEVWLSSTEIATLKKTGVI